MIFNKTRGTPLWQCHQTRVKAKRNTVSEGWGRLLNLWEWDQVDNRCWAEERAATARQKGSEREWEVGQEHTEHWPWPTSSCPRGPSPAEVVWTAGSACPWLQQVKTPRRGSSAQTHCVSPLPPFVIQTPICLNLLALINSFYISQTRGNCQSLVIS